MLDVDKSVRDRYSNAAQKQEAALCCPVEYNAQYLKIIPQEVIDRDYGCGDPSAYVKKGETVLDLGAGGGKICFIAAQVVGEKGKVIGVDMNDDMLALARSSQGQIVESMGYDNMSFFKGKIEDLAVDRDRVDSFLREYPVQSEADLQRLERFEAEMRREAPMIADDSIDVVVSNCVLNLVEQGKKRQMFEEIFRVLKPGGRAVISDIVSDELVPEHMRNDSELWSGCISGAFQESEFLQAFEEAGFYGVEVLVADEKPWQTVEGIEFRSFTVAAYKDADAKDWDHNEAAIYKGPFASVEDEEGNVFLRGERMAVSRRMFNRLKTGAYSEHFDLVTPIEEVGCCDRKPFTAENQLRGPKQTKGEGYKATVDNTGSSCC